MSSKSDGLSNEEFLQLQEQLIELRNANYELKEKLKKATVLEGDGHSAKKDALQFASRLLTRNQPDRDKFEAEVDSLRLKLQQQEEEFRLQQQTFMEELNKMSRANDELQKEKDGVQNINTENGESRLAQRELQLTTLEETLASEKVKSLRLSEELDIQNGLVKAFEDTVLNLREENLELGRKLEESAIHGQQKITKVANEMSELKEHYTRNLLEKDKTISQNEQELDVYKHKNFKGQIDNLEAKLIDNEKETDSFRQTLAQTAEENEHLRKKLEELRRLHESELGHQKEELQKIEAKMIEQSAEYETLLSEKECQYQTELLSMKEAFNKEKKALSNRIERLTTDLESKDEEKLLALKKQNFMIKELQKAVKDEKRRADSVEKLKEKDWHVVESDARSNLTFDGNESVSSLSALESDNVELINKLTALQKSYSEVVDTSKHLEFENESLKKEVLEKSEVIEHWIRARPLTTGSQKNENPLRKLLASTLAGDEQVNDLKDMNRRLQRMLEETLSKNIILQRDIQTLLERTEM